MNRKRCLVAMMLAVEVAAGQSIRWSTYLGGTGDDFPQAVAVDRDNNVYVAGYTTSTDFNGPTASRTFHSDIFISKFDPAGSLAYFRRMGGDGVEQAKALGVGPDGSLYVASTTWGSSFPTRNAAFSQLRGTSDTFVMRLSPTGEVVYSTFLGLATADGGAGIAVDKAGNAYVLSRSHTSFIGGVDTSTAIHVTKLDASGRLEFRYQLGEIGGKGNNYPGSIAVDPEGGIWLTGSTNWESFPATDGDTGVAPTIGTGFLAKVDAQGRNLLYATTDIQPHATLVTDPAGNVHIWTKTERHAGQLMLRSVDAGATWAGHDFLDRREPLESLRFSAGPSPKLFARAFGDLIRSEDGGLTWQTLLANPMAWTHFALHPGDPQTLFAGVDALFRGGLWKSADGGETWKQVWDPEWGVWAVAVDPESPDTVYASECSYRGSFVAKLVEGGEKVAQIQWIGDGSVCVSNLEAAGGTVFALTYNRDLLRSADGGRTWETARKDVIGMKARGSAIFAWTVTGLARSDDRGQSWVEVSKGVVHDLAFDPESPKILYASTIEGISKSTDGGATWTVVAAQSGAPASIAVDPERPSIVYAGFASRLTYPVRPVLRRIDGTQPPRQVPPSVAMPAALAVLDDTGKIFLAGDAGADNIPMRNAIQPKFGGGNSDTFLAGIRADDSFEFATYLGSSDNERATGIAIDRDGNILLTGWTAGSDFPVKNAVQPEYRGNIDGFVIKIAPR